MTLHGIININRTVLRPKTNEGSVLLKSSQNVSSIVPLDEYLGLNKLPFKMTIGVMLEIAYWVQRSNSYDDAEEGLHHCSNITVKNDTIRFVANTIGKIIFDNDLSSAENVWKQFTTGTLTFPKHNNNLDVYIECDGAMFHTRERDENGYTWKENKLGIVFTNKSFLRWVNKKTNKQCKSIGDRQYIAYAGSVEIFQKLLFDLAIQNGYGNNKNTILITDGAIWIKNMKDLIFPDAIHILDYFHLCENVHKFGKEYFNDNESEYKPWCDDICEKLRNSETDSVFDILSSLNKRKSNKCMFNLHNYLVKNINSIDYKTYEDNDWFIGSGAIESANKIVLQERLKQAGMRWNLETARYIISLMAKVKSHLWDRDVVQAVYRHYGVSRKEDLEARIL
jgi:hypothetical protein